MQIKVDLDVFDVFDNFVDFNDFDVLIFKFLFNFDTLLVNFC